MPRGWQSAAAAPGQSRRESSHCARGSGRLFESCSEIRQGAQGALARAGVLANTAEVLQDVRDARAGDRRTFGAHPTERGGGAQRGASERRRGSGGDQRSRDEGTRERMQIEHEPPWARVPQLGVLRGDAGIAPSVEPRPRAPFGHAGVIGAVHRAGCLAEAERYASLFEPEAKLAEGRNGGGQ